MGDMNLRNIPDDLRRAFKAYCTIRGITMRDRIVELMSQDIEKRSKSLLPDVGTEPQLPGQSTNPVFAALEEGIEADMQEFLANTQKRREGK